MGNMQKRNTLVLGNGFSRNVFADMPSWKSLFGNVDSKIKNYTILYEVCLLRDKTRNPSENMDNAFKRDLIKQIENAQTLENLNKGVLDVEKFGTYLVQNNIDNIITTNYDRGIELILCKKCGYKKVESENSKTEDSKKEMIYSIRAYKEYKNDRTGHKLRLWKIHGDLDRIESITLGFDQYCGSLAKLAEYIKGTYQSHTGPSCTTKMIEKLEKQTFDNLSWAELFFTTDIYIVGLGMDFSEIDIWWLINKHMRIKWEKSQIKNNIYYLYDKKYDKKEAIFEALTAFDVKCCAISSGKNYIRNIFGGMNK